MPQYKNILIALDGQMAPQVMERLQGIFREILKKNDNKLQIGRLDFVDNKEDIERLVGGLNYDVLLLTERIRGVNIGVGSIKAWKSKNHLLDIILFIDASKKGGEKVRSLHKDGYYNAVYHTDLMGHSGMIIDLILNGRTAEDALSYYGLEESPILVEEPAIEQPVNDTVAEDVVVPQNNASVVVDTPLVEVQDIPVAENVSYEEPVEEQSYHSEESVVNMETDVSAAVEEELVVDEVPTWFTEKEGKPIIEEREEDYAKTSDNDEGYVEYERYSANEVRVLPRKAVDADSLGGETAVMVRGKISSIVTDTVMVIECPNGGLLKNKALIENRVVTLLL